MATAREVASQYLVKDYLDRVPDYIDLIEWLDDTPEIILDDGYDDNDVHDEVSILLHEVRGYLTLTGGLTWRQETTAR